MPDPSQWLSRWGLISDGAPFPGARCVVYPVLRDGLPLALKVCRDDNVDALFEAVALRHWAGRGVARLVAAEPSAGVLLLQRLDASLDLREAWIDQVSEHVGALLIELCRPAPPNLPVAAEALDRALTGEGAVTLPRRFVDRARRLLGELPDPGLLLHRTLHSRHLLFDPETAGYKAISPRPASGHQGLELVSHLLERPEEYPEGSGLRWGTRHRIELACEAADLPEEEARLWALVGVTAEAGLASGQHERLTFLMAVLKTLDG